MAKATKLFLGETNLFRSRRGVQAYDLRLVVHNSEREKYGELTSHKKYFTLLLPTGSAGAGDAHFPRR